jgi:hypothetical protein
MKPIKTNTMKTKILLFALAVTVTVGAAAQTPITFGVRAGLNFDNQSGGGESADSKVGFHVGGIADIPLTNLAASLPEWFYLQPGLYLTTKGSKVGEATISLYYLELPVLASAKFPLTGDINLRVHFGPSFGFAVSGKYKETEDGETESHDIFGEGSDASRFNFGLVFGAGVEYSKFYAGLGYNLGLSSVSEKEKNSTFGITLGYNF